MIRVLVVALVSIACVAFAHAQSTITIGDTKIESAVDNGNGNTLLAQHATLLQGATINSLSFYVRTARGNLILGVYDATGPGGGPGVLRAATVGFTPASGWNTHSVVTPVALPAGNYWLAYLPSSNNLTFRKQNNSGNCVYYKQSYGALPATFSASTNDCTPTTWSFYATLTPSSSNQVNGVCGPASGVPALTAPATNLCSAGTASAVSGIGPWNWTCAGSGGGTTAACSAPLQQQSSGILPADRDASVNWKMAGLQSIGGIPNRTTQCGATISPRGGGLDDTASIQNAINNCPAGQVVQLAAGTFTVTEGGYVQMNKGVTLRGAGTGATVLTRTNGATLGTYVPGNNPSPMILAAQQIYGSGPAGSSALSADAAKGSYSVQVTSAANFVAGQIVVLDEASGAGWQPDVAVSGLQIWAAPDYRVVWAKHNPSQDGDDFAAGEYPYTTGSAGCWFSNCDRPTNEMHLITAVTGNTITFDSPVTISYRTGHQAMLSYFTPDQFVWEAGVENLTVEYGDNDNIRFDTCAYCWAKNVESRLWLNVGIDLVTSFRTQLEGVYVHETVWPVPGGGGYAIGSQWWSSEFLIENSISVLANKVMVARSSGAGSVVAYNYMDDGFISGETWVEIGLNASHMVGSHHVLFEGNWGFNADSDQTHGNAIYMVNFRNWLTGYRTKFTDYLTNTVVDDSSGCCGPLRAASPHDYAYWHSFIGNVLGTPGKMAGWADNCISGQNYIPSQCIWMMGWVDISPQGYDPNVAATAIRDGNWDNLTNSQQWYTTPGGFTIPNSLYLSAAPAFFGSNPWPWTEPSAGAVYTLPAKARYDAGTPFVQP
jgi:hypothetical protein